MIVLSDDDNDFRRRGEAISRDALSGTDEKWVQERIRWRVNEMSNREAPPFFWEVQGCHGGLGAVARRGQGTLAGPRIYKYF